MEAVHIQGVCAGLQAMGVEVEVVGPPGVDLADDAAGTARPSRWGRVARAVPQPVFEAMELAYTYAALPRLRKRIAEWRPDFVYERYALFNLAGVRAAREAGLPFVVEINEVVDVDRVRAGKSLRLKALARRCEREILSGAQGIVAVSAYLADCAVRAGADPARVIVTPNAVDAERFNPDREGIGAVRSRLGLDGRVVIGFTGSFAPWHRVDLLVDAFAAVAQDHRDAHLLLVGDGLEIANVRAAATRLGMEDRVTFAGRISHADVPAYVAAMDVGVMPASNAFGSPMKVFEYMAMRVAPVAPRLGPLEEAIDDGATGVLFEPDSGAALAAALSALLSDRDRLKQIGVAARAAVLERFQWRSNASSVLNLIASGIQ